jgi:signal transduction histidine kinase
MSVERTSRGAQDAGEFTSTQEPAMPPDALSPSTDREPDPRSEEPRARSRISSREALRFLSEAGQTLASTLDYETTLQALAELAVPRVACFCVVDILEEDGRVRRLGMAHVDPGQLPTLRRTAEYSREPTPGSHLERMLEEGEPVLVSPVTDEWLEGVSDDVQQQEIMRQLVPTSLMLVPLAARGNRLGVLLLASTRTDRYYGPSDVSLARELGRVASVAIDNSRLYRKAQNAVRARDEVLRVVSHDLRNPLNTVMMGADLLLEDAQGELREGPFGRTLRMMRNATESANRMIGDLLDVSRIEAGQLAIELSAVSLAPLLDEAVERHRQLAAERGIELRVREDDTLPDVLADRDRVLQILGNLLGNALKFTPSGGRIEVGMEAEGDEILCYVADSGPGIPAEQLPHIFDRFWQAHRSDRRGLGLGLAIVQGLVEAHGGRVWAESEAGRGTRFQFTLPRAPGSRDHLVEGSGY